MKKILLLLLCTLLLLSGCTEITSPTLIQMELTSDYDTSDPFINEKLFCVDKNLDILELDISLQMKGGSGILEIADNKKNKLYGVIPGMEMLTKPSSLFHWML